MNDKELKELQRVLDDPSLWPDKPRKTREEREADLRSWYEKYGEIDECYNLYGFDIVGADKQEEFLDRKAFRKERHDVNSEFYPQGSNFPYDYVLMMRDKYSFEMFARMLFGSDTSKYCGSFAYLIGESLFIRKKQKNGNEIMTPVDMGKFEAFLKSFEGQRLVFKLAFGGSGKEVFFFKIENGTLISLEDDGKENVVDIRSSIKNLMAPNATWLLQPYIDQHPDMMKLNPTSLNTMRIITYHTGTSVHHAHVTVRFGRPGSYKDNTDNGGFFAGVSEEGIVEGDRFAFLARTREPNPFAGNRIPYFKEAVKLAEMLHTCMPGLFTVGWDIAITEHGPMVIEGNDGWDPYLTQIPSGSAQRENWNRYLAKRKRNMTV